MRVPATDRPHHSATSWGTLRSVAVVAVASAVGMAGGTALAKTSEKPAAERHYSVSTVLQSPTPAPPPPSAPQAAWVVPADGRLSSHFRTTERPTHQGLDIAARRGTPVRAASAGVVIAARCDTSGPHCDMDGGLHVRGCGWGVQIQHADRVVTRYCHLVGRPLVAVGQQVQAGQQVGAVGSSGNSTGPHLHFEVYVDAGPIAPEKAMDPARFLTRHGATLPR